MNTKSIWTTLFSGLLIVAQIFAVSSIGAFAGATGSYAQPVPSSARAGQKSCAELRGLRSQKSTEPTQLTFVNESGMYRALLWIDFQGSPKDFGGLNSGERKTVSTFRGHPWMIATGPGDCIYVVMPAAESAVVRLK